MRNILKGLLRPCGTQITPLGCVYGEKLGAICPVRGNLVAGGSSGFQNQGISNDWHKYPGDRNTPYQAFDLPRRRGIFWPLLHRFGNRPWFRRLGVIQEFALAQNLVVLLGDYLVEERSLLYGAERAVEHYHFLLSLDS
jgi:hypothetical protein